VVVNADHGKLATSRALSIFAISFAAPFDIADCCARVASGHIAALESRDESAPSHTSLPKIGR
jgi:hypothetical protein